MSRKHMHALRPERMYNRRPANPFTRAERAEGLLAHLDPEMPAQFDKFDINALHAEALRMDQFMGTEDSDWYDESWYDGDEGWFSNDVYFEGDDGIPNMYSHDDHWIAYAKDMEQVRDIFGGTDFIIIHQFRA